MAKLTPDEAAEKHARRLTGAVEDIRRGVDATTVNPAEKAIAAKAKMVARFNAAMEDGSWERGLATVTLESWKTAMREKGIGRIAAGIAGARGKVVAFYSQLFPFQDGLKGEIDRMPDVTLEDSIQRATTWIRRMAEFKKT